MGRRLFCEISPLCYRISEKKEQLKRCLRDFFDRETFAKTKSDVKLPFIWKGHTSPMLRKLYGVDMQLQYNKVHNLSLAGNRINGVIIKPGETFSFWHTVGACTKRRGYLDGLVIRGSTFSADTGGGICQLANLIHYMVLHSPLSVTELHHHSDALFPDSARRVPFGTGTSVGYNMFDYRFKNTTEIPVQLCIWQDENTLFGELRADAPSDYRYRLIEESSYYTKENGCYYRNSEVFRIITPRDGGESVKELILRNHSRVMYDYSLIPAGEIREEAHNA